MRRGFLEPAEIGEIKLDLFNFLKYFISTPHEERLQSIGQMMLNSMAAPAVDNMDKVLESETDEEKLKKDQEITS